jgi:hypothetical protein
VNRMAQKLMLKAAVPQIATKQFTLRTPEIQDIFPGLKTGDFAVIYGSPVVTSFVSKLCVRAQMPSQAGGLDSNVVLIDCATSSSLSNISEAAEEQQLDAKTVLGRISNMRAYTAYRLTSLIMETLEEAVEVADAKLVVISDIVSAFLSGNVDDQEAKAVFSQIMGYLSTFARRHKIVVIATYLQHEDNRRNQTLQEITNQKANTVLRFTKTPYTSEVELEKHPTYMLGIADFNAQPQAATDFSILTNEPSLTYQIL